MKEAVSRSKTSRHGEKIGPHIDREVQDGESLIDHLINYTDDPIILQDETLNILLAGRDTATNSISYAIYILAKHPHILSRLRDEFLTKIGSSRRTTYDDMKEMKYLRAVINETLPLYPAMRTVQCSNFKQGNPVASLTPNPFIFLPFDTGPRIHLGQQFAYHETSFFLIRLLQNRSMISLAPEAQQPEHLPLAD